MTSEVAGALGRAYTNGPGHGDTTDGTTGDPIADTTAGSDTAEPSALIERLVLAADEIARLRSELELERARTSGIDAAESLSTLELEATRRTWSWRVTAPLRTVRRAQLERFGQRSAGARNGGQSLTGDTRRGRVGIEDGVLEDRRTRRRAVAALWHRAAAATGLIDATIPSPGPAEPTPGPAEPTPGPADVVGAGALAAFAAAVERTAGGDQCSPRISWLAALVALGRYPTPAEVDRVRRVIGSGVEPLSRLLLDEFERSSADGRVACLLDPIVGATVVDLSTSLGSTDLAGIQRVVRSVIPRWSAQHRFVAVAWDDDAAGFVAVTDERLRALAYGDVSAAPTPRSRTGGAPHDPRLSVPWDCRYVVPELAVGSHERMSAMRALVTAGPLTSTGLVGYDLIPVTSSETVDRGFVGAFGEYLAVVKHATRVAAISRSAAEEFRTYSKLLASQGLDGPDVVACPLPQEAHPASAASRAGLRTKLAAGDRPIVLVVGSHEPRKNHLSVLAAAERLWAEGHSFHLAFFGGLSWGSDEFESEVERLGDAGATISVHRRVTEEELWAGYAEARCTVFPSLVEGYGLPVAESLSAGCPVLVSDYGSMSELAADGGALTVDPRDLGAITRCLRDLLTDDELVARLRAEASARPSSSWDDYAERLWHALVDGGAVTDPQEAPSPRRTAATTDV